MRIKLAIAIANAKGSAVDLSAPALERPFLSAREPRMTVGGDSSWRFSV